MHGWEDVFVEFVAGELGRSEERCEDVDEIGSVVINERSVRNIWNGMSRTRRRAGTRL